MRHAQAPILTVRFGLVLQKILQPVDIYWRSNVRVSNQGPKQRQRGLDALDDEFIERSPQSHQRFGAGSAVDDQFANQGIIIRRDHIALIGSRIDTNAEAPGG